MNFRRFYFQWMRLLLAIHGFAGLLLGYWDIRLSDTFLYHGQISRTQYMRTLQAHFVFALVLSVAFAYVLARYHWRRTERLEREEVIPSQLSFAVSYLLFVILGIKIHLIWLETHLMDLQGLLWTAGLLVSCILVFFILRHVFRRIYTQPARSRFAAVAFLIALIGTGVDAYLNQTRSHASSAKPGPNVLLIVADTLRWDHVSAYGKIRNITPNIDRLAKDGTLYENAISASPWTTPSHAAMFTGQYPTRNGVEGRNIFLDPATTTIAEYLVRHGYQTAGFVNNVYIRRQTGMASGFQQYEEFWGRNAASSSLLLVELLLQKWKPRRDSGARQTVEAVQHWIERDWQGTSPFFLFVHFMEPHAPYGAPPDYLRDFLPRDITREQALNINQDPELYICRKLPMNERDFRGLRGLYNSDIRYMDSQIGRLLSFFRGRKILDNTLVVFVSDHGEHFGDHQLMSHELSLYDALIRVPMIVRHPGTVPAGKRIAAPVQTLDLFPSILGFLKIGAGHLRLQGASLLPHSFQRANLPFTFAEYNNARAIDKIERRFPGIHLDPVFRRKMLRAVRSADLKLIYGDDGTRELYDIRKDPEEANNVYSTEPETARVLEGVLAKWATSFEASRFYKQEEISREALEELRALGYVQ